MSPVTVAQAVSLLIIPRRLTKFGTRSICFFALTIADNAQLNKISTGTPEIFWEQNYTIDNAEYDGFGNKDVAKQYTLHDYVAHVVFNKDYSQLDQAQQIQAKDWFVNTLNSETKYTFDRQSDTYTLIQGNAPDGAKTSNAYKTVFCKARSVFASQVTKGEYGALPVHSYPNDKEQFEDTEHNAFTDTEFDFYAGWDADIWFGNATNGDNVIIPEVGTYTITLAGGVVTATKN